MTAYKYLIIGGGMTADAAVEGIREVDPKGSIGVISAETDRPYNRPPLTKGLWKDQKPDSIWREAAAKNSELHLGRKVEAISLRGRHVTDNQGHSYSFEKLLLATGGRPRQLPFGGDSIIYYRTFADYQRLRALTEKGRRFAVIGGGFIGSELAASLAMNQKEVVMIFPGKAIGERMYPADLSAFLNDYYRQKGVELLTEETVSDVEKRADRTVVRTKTGKEIVADGVIAGLGIEPNVELAEQAGLRVENGIVVDEFLCTSHPGVYAAGDVVAFYSPALMRRLRVEHEDNANTMGRHAGRNMAGVPQAYTHLPFFYSDLFDLGYEAVGETDSRLAIVANWKVPFREGVVYYHHEGQVRGVLLWNVWGQVDAARGLIQGKRQFQSEELKNQLPKAA
jgi:3-phenylpropionate/trans-cinnamate dioxygenase ferredoxin reductase subunit